MRIDPLGAAPARHASPADPAPGLSLCDLPRHVPAEVLHVTVPEQPAERDIVLRLVEIGFVPGEPLRVIAHGLPGGEPIAVRLGDTTFALRRFEASFVRVQPLVQPQAQAPGQPRAASSTSSTPVSSPDRAAGAAWPQAGR